MDSGRKERVMISCVVTETTKVTEPIKYYDVSKAYLIHYVSQKSPDSAWLYREFYERVCEIISSERPNVTIESINAKVYSFDDMLRSILEIISKEKSKGKCEIYINISSGSPEYAAAAAIASMMEGGVIAFSVNTMTRTLDNEEDLRRALYIDGNPVGFTKEPREPLMLPHYDIKKPEEYLVRGLRILDMRLKAKLPTSSSAMADALIENGVWFRNSDKEGSSKKQSDAVNYHRDYTTKWIDKGWVRKDPLRRGFIPTDEGKKILEIFYTEN